MHSLRLELHHSLRSAPIHLIVHQKSFFLGSFINKPEAAWLCLKESVSISERRGWQSEHQDLDPAFRRSGKRQFDEPHQQNCACHPRFEASHSQVVPDFGLSNLPLSTLTNLALDSELCSFKFTIFGITIHKVPTTITTY